MIDMNIIKKNKDKINNFEPTKEQIEAAEDVFCCMSKYEATKETVEPIKKMVLAKNEFYTRKDYEGEPFMIKNPENIWLLEDEDFNTYLKQVYEERVKYGFLDDKEICVISKAQQDLVMAERKLIDTFVELTGVSNDHIRHVEHREKYIDILMSMIVNFVNPDKVLEKALQWENKNVTK